MIYVEPCGGLCNRMRAINSAFYISKKYNLEMTIIWNMNSDLFCEFDRLFIFPKNIKVVTIKNNFPMKLARIIRYQLTMQKFDDKRIEANRNNKTIDMSMIDFSKDVYFKTGHQFFDFDSFSVFEINEKVMYSANKIINNYSSNTIGVHIRRTDNEKSKENSKIENFVNKMNKEIEYDNEVKFYLATDDKEVETYLISIFGDRIISFEEKVLNRASEEGIGDALIDIVCLSRTNRIIGSYWSSFSEVSAQLGNIDLQVIVS